MKSRFLKISLLISVPVLVLVSVLYAGSLSPTVTTETPTMVTLSDINNLILNNVTTATSSDHTVSTTSSPTTTFVSIEELYVNLVNLIQPEFVKTGETILGITGTFAEVQQWRQTIGTSSTSLTPQESPMSTGYTLEDIYNLINSNSTTTVASHSFTNSSSVSSSMRSLSSLYYDLSTLINPAHIATGTTYLGVIGTYFPDITGLVAHFKMNDNEANTIVENTLATSDTTHVAGKFDNAIDFAGNKYIDLGNNFGFEFGSFSISMWVYVDEYISGDGDTAYTHAFLFSKDDDMNGRGYVFGIKDSDGGHYSYIELGGVPTLTGIIDIPVGSWHNLTFTFNSETGNYDTYVDGSYDSSTFASNPPSTGAVATLGRRLYTGNLEPLDGKMDDITIFDRVLSSEEISSIYNSGAGLEGNVGIAPFNSGLSAGYNLDESSGTVVSDFSGNSINAALVGFSDGNGTATQNTNLMYTTGKINGALGFDGSSDYIFGQTLNITGSSPRTISGWLKSDSTDYSVASGYFFSTGGYAAIYHHFGLAANGNPATWQFTEGTLWFDTTISVSTNYQHIVVTFDGTNVNFYSNGELASSFEYLTSDTQATAPYFGSLSGGTEGYFDGDIDDIRIYDRVLDIAEIKALYFMGSGTEEE